MRVRGGRAAARPVGPVSWEIAGVRQELEEQGFQMRWTFSIAVRNLGDTGIAFEEVEIGSQPGGTVDHFWGGIGTEPFTRRLEPGGELQLRRSHVSSCPLCRRPSSTGPSPMASSSTSP